MLLIIFASIPASVLSEPFLAVAPGDLSRPRIDTRSSYCMHADRDLKARHVRTGTVGDSLSSH